MAKTDISDLSPQEKLRFRQFENLWKEGTGFYWKVAILLFFFWPIMDIIPTITFSSFGGPIHGYLPNIPFNMNNMAQLCYQFNVFFMTFGFFISFMIPHEAKRKKLVATLIIMVWAVWFAYIAANEDWIKDALSRQIITVTEFYIFLGITVFLSIKVRWSRFIWVIAAYLVILLVLYYVFYYPLSLSSVNPWPSPPSFSAPPFGVIGLALPVLGIISAILMALASSERCRRWATFSHILEERKKAERKQA
jgi:hypothetical protein